MRLELEDKLVVVDLRTKEDVLDYIKKYSVNIVSYGDETFYTEGLYDFKKETGMSDEQVVDMLFDVENNEERMAIEETYYTDCGNTRTFELVLGEISYFEYEDCNYEPDYSYVNKISKDEFYKKVKTIREFIAKLDEMESGGINNASK